MEELDVVEAQTVAAAAEAQTTAVGGNDEAESTFDVDSELTNLENRITNVEATFAYIKEMRARKGKDGASSSKAGSSRKKNKWVVSSELFPLICSFGC